MSNDGKDYNGKSELKGWKMDARPQNKEKAVSEPARIVPWVG